MYSSISAGERLVFLAGPGYALSVSFSAPENRDLWPSSTTAAPSAGTAGPVPLLHPLSWKSGDGNFSAKIFVTWNTKLPAYLYVNLSNTLASVLYSEYSVTTHGEGSSRPLSFC
jgi:hypothetical protein